MQLSNNKKINYIQFLLPIIVFFIYGYNLFNINQNLDSLCDEGYLYLMIQAANKGIHDGLSQWPTIIDVVFGNNIISNILYLRLARYFVHLLSISLFFITVKWYLKKKGVVDSFENKLLLFSSVFLLGTLSCEPIVISYNTLQEFFLLGIIVSFLISTVCDLRKRFLFYFLFGFFSFWSVLNILPSGVLVFFSIFSYAIIKNYNSWKSLSSLIAWLLVGMLFAAIIFHYCFLSLDIVFHNMFKTFHTVKQWGAGYDSKSFLINIFIYFRDLFMGLCLLLGSGVVAYYLAISFNKWVASIFFCLSMVLFSFYQIKPQMPLSTFVSFPLVMLLLLKIKTTNGFDTKKCFSFDFLFYLLLFFLPLLSTIGTNLYLGSKLLFFILPWGILFIELIVDIKLNALYEKEMELVKWLFVGILVIYSLYSTISGWSEATEVRYFRKKSPISQIKLTKCQLAYFNRVDSIMELYGYTPNEYVFSTQLDHMTIAALDASPHGIYFFPTMFLIDPNKQKANKPDFLFLDDYDMKTMGDSLQSLGWGFPKDYDSIYVGTPETLKMSYSTERTLYCLKKRKIIDK